MTEKELQNMIRVGCSDIAVLFRANVGTFQQGDRFISTGLPRGFPDLFGFRRRDGRFVALEVKAYQGRVRKDQQDMIAHLVGAGAIAGVVRSVDDARRLIE